ncbi:MAG: ATP-binding cassette domain-containing protein [Bacteroidales bacterium]
MKPLLELNGHSENTILTLNELSIAFSHEGKENLAVDQISFSLRRGVHLVLLGESGSGKSVTSLAIIDLVPRPAGKITGGSIIFHAANGENTDLLYFFQNRR